VSRDVFNAMLADAARDSGAACSCSRPPRGSDHPELLNVPETDI